jgi:hypothetical protein
VLYIRDILLGAQEMEVQEDQGRAGAPTPAETAVGSKGKVDQLICDIQDDLD